jgi:hypothetical protein
MQLAMLTPMSIFQPMLALLKLCTPSPRAPLLPRSALDPAGADDPCAVTPCITSTLSRLRSRTVGWFVVAIWIAAAVLRQRWNAELHICQHHLQTLCIQIANTHSIPQWASDQILTAQLSECFCDGHDSAACAADCGLLAANASTKDTPAHQPQLWTHESAAADQQEIKGTWASSSTGYRPQQHSAPAIQLHSSVVQQGL